jgi:adenosylmethionine-8-amino-7-oxononanoate aminotransferase
MANSDIRGDDALAVRDLRHLWHPCSQMHDYENFTPVHLVGAEGPFLIAADGRRIIDAISSWWCKSLGHRHPRIVAAMKAQLDRFEHVIGANTCVEPLVTLAERLAKLAPGLSRSFFAGDGSSAVEVALKMSLQYHAQCGHPERSRFIALEHGYHGETLMTLAVGDCGIYGAPFAGVMPTVPKLSGLPESSGPGDPAWADDLTEEEWRPLACQLAKFAPETVAAVIVEPIVQGAGGMRCLRPGLLRRLRRWTREHGVLLIADEIMTGFARTGPMLAVEHAGIVPDLVCISKGLTAGCAPMSAVLCGEELYQAFYGDYGSGRAFLHSNTYSGYALGAAAAVATMDVMAEEDIAGSVARRGQALRGRMAQVATATGALVRVRGVGFVAAADLADPATGQPFPSAARVGYQVFQEGIRRGAWLRPLGDTIYFLPPLNTPDAVLDDLAGIAAESIRAAIRRL